MIEHVPPRLFTEDFEAEFLQLAEVLVQRLALRVHAVGFEPVDDLLQGQGMGIVRLFGEDFDEIEHFELLIITGRHRDASRIKDRKSIAEGEEKHKHLPQMRDRCLFLVIAS